MRPLIAVLFVGLAPLALADEKPAPAPGAPKTPKHDTSLDDLIEGAAPGPVTQPPTAAAAPHQLTLTVQLANAAGVRATYQQSRNVRMSSIGRRAVLFVVPADRITTDDGAQVTLKVTLSAPAKPATRE